MPLFQTDITEGQTAALNQQLNPLRAAEEAKQLPLQTELLQQKVTKNNLDAQKETLELQAFMQGQKDDVAMKDAVEKYATDPANKDKPTSKKMEELATLVGGKGNIKGYETLLNYSATAAEREERMAKLAREKDQHDLAGINRVITTATPDNLAEKELELQNYGFDPKLVKQFVDSAEAAKRAGILPQYLAEAKKHFDSDASKKEREIEAKDKQTNENRKAELDVQNRKLDLLANRGIAADRNREAREDRQDKETNRTNLDTAKQATTIINNSNKVIQQNLKDIEKLSTRPKKASMYDTGEEAAIAEWDKKKADIDESTRDAKDDIKEARDRRERAMEKLSPDFAKQVPKLETSAPTKAPGAATSNIPQSAIDDLKSGKGTDAQFDEIFGEGSAAKARGKTEPTKQVEKPKETTGNSRESMFKRGEKFKDQELSRLKLMTQSKDQNMSTKAYIDYVERLKVLEGH